MNWTTWQFRPSETSAFDVSTYPPGLAFSVRVGKRKTDRESRDPPRLCLTALEISANKYQRSQFGDRKESKTSSGKVFLFPGCCRQDSALTYYPKHLSGRRCMFSARVMDYTYIISLQQAHKSVNLPPVTRQTLALFTKYEVVFNRVRVPRMTER